MQLVLMRCAQAKIFEGGLQSGAVEPRHVEPGSLEGLMAAASERAAQLVL